MWQATLRFVATLWNKRDVIAALARREMISQHRGTYLGGFWLYAHPLAYVIIIYLVFTLGLRSNPAGKVHYAPFLISGMVAWQFFVSTLSSLSGIIRAHSFLIKKGDFSLAILHVAKLIAAIIPHGVLIILAVVIAWASGIAPTLLTLQIPYYLLAMALLLLGLGWITSSTTLFVEDVSHVVQIILQFGFWFTPIIWNIETISPQWRWIFRLNPMCYIVSGYRDALIHHIPFWARPRETIFFWTITTLLLLLGATVFRRLKPHFGEVV